MNLLKSETDAISLSHPSAEEDAIDFERLVAYSREPGQPKQYVQSLVKRDAEKIYDIWINRGGYIYVCGKIKMAEDVENTLQEMLVDHGQMDANAAVEKIADMKKEFRYLEDIFG